MLEEVHFLLVRHDDQWMIVNVNGIGFITRRNAGLAVIPVKKYFLFWILVAFLDQVASGVFYEIAVDVDDSLKLALLFFCFWLLAFPSFCLC